MADVYESASTKTESRVLESSASPEHSPYPGGSSGLVNNGRNATISNGTQWNGTLAYSIQKSTIATSQHAPIFTAAPWLQDSDQTTIYFEEAFTVFEQIITKTFAVCVPASTAYPVITVTSSILDCTASITLSGQGVGGDYSTTYPTTALTSVGFTPTNVASESESGFSGHITASTPSNTEIVPGPGPGTENPGYTSTVFVTITKTESLEGFANPMASTSTEPDALPVGTNSVYTSTSTVSAVIEGSVGQNSPSSKQIITETLSTTSQINTYLRSTSAQSSFTRFRNTSSTTAPYTTPSLHGSVPISSAPSSSLSTESSLPSPPTTLSSSTFAPTSGPIFATSTESSISHENTTSTLPLNSTMPGNTSSRSSTPTPTSSTSPNEIAKCTQAAAGGPIPQPSSGLDLLNVGSMDAPYDLSQAALLDSISFPNGLECRENLVILFPGTAVPALDTFTSTFIPAFRDVSVANADVMVVSNPGVSLGDAQTTAEYAAFAINYARLVLGRRATIVPWSQGNLNTQWALKYWPSTRQNLKNYVAMSPDYDGTLDASFLCDPEKLLTSNLATLAENFLSDDGLGTSLTSILGIGALPTSAEQFRLYLLALLSGDMSSYLSNLTANASSAGVSTSSSSPVLTRLPVVTKRAVPFGTPNQAEIDARAIKTALEHRAIDLAKRQGAEGSTSPVAQLLAGLTGPISDAVESLAVRPDSVLEEVLSNVGGNLLDLHLPTVLPQGCLPSIWQQTYSSNFAKTLATDYGNGAGDSAFVPTTTVFSITDEVVQPQGATGFEDASGYLKNASNILIQGNGGCPIVASTLISGLPTVITHEGVLYSGMGVIVAVEAVKSGGEVTVDMIDATVRCDLVSPLLTVNDALAQEATIPGALTRVFIGGGDETLASDFLPAEPPIKAYATVPH